MHLRYGLTLAAHPFHPRLIGERQEISGEDLGMKSETLGKGISEVEVSHISQHGLWLLLQDRELFVPFTEFPWFKDASIGAILNVEMPHPRHLYWPGLDIDLAVDSIEHPEQFPLISKIPNTPSGM
jgi:hypothetical protein